MCDVRLTASGLVALIAWLVPAVAGARAPEQAALDESVPSQHSTTEPVPEEAESGSEAQVSQGAPPSAQERELAELRATTEELRRTVNELKESIDRANARAVQPGAETREPVLAPAPAISTGRWYLGGTFGVGVNSAEDTETLVASVDEEERTRFFVQALFGRVLIDSALAVGLVLRYDRNRSEGSLDAGSGPERRGVSEYTVRAGPSVRQFLPLDSSARIFAFYQAALFFGYGEGVERSFLETSSTVTTSELTSVGLNVQPGIAVAATRNLAVEVSLDVFGIDLERVTSTTDYLREGRQTAFDLNLGVNLLSLQFAFVGYF